MRKKYFAVKVKTLEGKGKDTVKVRSWNRLLGEAVDVTSLQVFKVRLNGILGNLVQ